MVSRGTATIWNGEVGYRLSNKAHVVFEAFNIFDAKASDIDYFYASRVPGLRTGWKTSTRIRLFRDPSTSVSVLVLKTQLIG